MSALALLLLTSCASPGRADPTGQVASLALTHVSVVDVRDGRVVPDQTVIIRGNRIAALGSAAVLSVPGGAQVVDGRGKYLIPGLWDMHVHVLSGERLSTLPLYVANGVTRVRDMGGTLPLAEQQAVRRSLKLGERLGPTIAAAAGRIVVNPGPRDRLGGGMRSGAELFAYVAVPADAHRVVDSLQAAGADFIKVTRLSRDTYVAVAQAARARRVSFVGHVPTGMQPREAAEAGQRSIEHTGRLPISCSDSTRAAIWVLAAADTQTLQRGLPTCVAPDDSTTAALSTAMVRHQVWLVPTLVQMQLDQALLGDTTTFAAALRHTPAWLRRFWAADPLLVGTMPATARAALLGWPGRLAVAGAMHRAGVALLAGTDSPSYPYSSPGYSLHAELALLVKSGLTPAAALRAATLGPATFLGQADSLGTVAPSKVADLVLLDANPLADIRNTQRIAAVVLNGRYFDRRQLDDLLARAEQGAGALPR